MLMNFKIYYWGAFFLMALLLRHGSVNAQQPWSNAQEGDTITIQTFDFEHNKSIDSRDGIFLFPPDTFRYARIIMLYSRKCYNAQGHPDPYPCGEWDWNSPIRVWDKEGNGLELVRFVTPYGGDLHKTSHPNSLNYSGNGWTWMYDVTEFSPVLYDSVRVFNGEAGDYNGEISFGLVDIKFLFIVGTPPRDAKRVRNIYPEIWHKYATGIDAVLPEKTFDLRGDEKMAEVLVTAAGNCCDENGCPEFCAKNHELIVNKTHKLPHHLWLKEHCGMNPLYPQAGTWVFPRASWCPGSMADKKRFEITPFLTPGDSVTVKYRLQPYNPSNPAYYSIFGQIVTYSEPNFNLDARVEEIISPNNWEMQRRHNPICNNPKIIIKNTGASTLNSLSIEYGAENGEMQQYTWTGNLAFLEKEEVALPSMSLLGWTGGSNRFKVSVSNPNGQMDEYSFNNTAYATYNIPPRYDSIFYFQLRTNNTPKETSWKLENEAGELIYASGTLAANTTYRDTFKLTGGCYIFTLDDVECDGLYFWYYSNKGSGNASLRKVSTGQAFKTFTADFGCQIKQHFTVGYTLGDDYISVVENQSFDPDFTVYPNPTSGKLHMSFSFPEPSDIGIKMFSVMGQEIYQRKFEHVVNENITIEGDYPPGVYLILMTGDTYSVTKKVVFHR